METSLLTPPADASAGPKTGSAERRTNLRACGASLSKGCGDARKEWTTEPAGKA
jgi:hypothetical protein